MATDPKIRLDITGKKIILENEVTELQKILLRRKINEDKDLPSVEEALRRAATDGSKVEVEFLIKHVKDINHQDDNSTSKKTALHWAAKNRHQDVFDFLISKGAKADIKDAEGKTAMNYKVYNEKLDWLKSKWSKEKSDNTALRLISTILARPSNSVKYSIILDDLENFKLNYKNFYDKNLLDALKLSSLCGSEQITEFLLEQLKENYASPECNFILGYVCASNNSTWAMKIARYMSDKKASIPLSVYLYADSTQLDEIENIFHVIHESFNFLKK